MGKRSKQAKKAAQKKTGKPHKGPCYADDCDRRGGEIFACVTCEDLGRENPFRLQACSLHRFDALQEVKRHAVVKHPVNLLRVMGAALKGEDIT